MLKTLKFNNKKQKSLHLQRKKFARIDSCSKFTHVSFYFTRSIKPEKRNCLFPDENLNIKLHKNYTQANYLLECSFFYAQRQLQLKYNVPKACTPWYFPFVEDKPGTLKVSPEINQISHGFRGHIQKTFYDKFLKFFVTLSLNILRFYRPKAFFKVNISKG